MTAIFLDRYWFWQWRGLSLAVHKQHFKVGLWLFLACLAASGAALCIGSIPMSISQLLEGITGGGDPMVSLTLHEIRIPRLLANLVAGAALGAAGCLAQVIFANRLATPDILGIQEGAALAIVCFVMATLASTWPPWLAPIGAVAAVSLLLAINSRAGLDATGFLLCGVCLGELLRAVVEFLMSLGSLHEVQGIYIWLHGSFVAATPELSQTIAGVLLISSPFWWLLAYRLRLFKLSPAQAHSLGLNTRRWERLGIVGMAVLAALGTTIGGPVAFIAMAAPLLLGRLLGTSPQLPMLNCGLLGALLMVISDLVARQALAPQEIPVGVISRLGGGLILLFFLLGKGRSYGTSSP